MLDPNESNFPQLNEMMRTWSVRRSGVVAVWMLSASIAVLAQEPASAASENARSLYGAAFEKILNLEHPDAGRLGTCSAEGCWVETTRIDASSKALSQEFGPALALTRQAVGMENPAPASEQLATQDLITLTRQTRSLAGMLVLQARHEIVGGRLEAAVSDLLAALHVARDAAALSNFYAKLIEQGASGPALRVLAELLPSLPSEQVKALPARLAALPRSPSWSEVLRGEYQFGVKEAARQDAKMAELGGAAGFSTQAYAKLEPLYQALEAGDGQAPEAFQTLVDEQSKRFPNNPFAQVLKPMFVRVQLQVATVGVWYGMLDEGIRMVSEGPEARPQKSDPYGDGPFGFQAMANGFILVTELTNRGKAVSLKFGTDD